MYVFVFVRRHEEDINQLLELLSLTFMTYLFLCTRNIKLLYDRSYQMLSFS